MTLAMIYYFFFGTHFLLKKKKRKTKNKNEVQQILNKHNDLKGKMITITFTFSNHINLIQAIFVGRVDTLVF